MLTSPGACRGARWFTRWGRVVLVLLCHDCQYTRYDESGQRHRDAWPVSAVGTSKEPERGVLNEQE
jgi:hypothetical protein